MDELRPCPFCWGTNLEVRSTPFVGFTVRCWNDTCLASGLYKGTEKEAIEAWNRRADDGRQRCKNYFGRD